MRTLLVIILSVISLAGNAQITHEISFDKKSQVVHLTLTNLFDEIVFLSPRPHFGDSPNACYFVIKCKDANGGVTDTIRSYISTKTLDYLEPKQSGKYKLPLRTLLQVYKIDGIRSIDAGVHIEAADTKWRTLFKKDVSQEFQVE